MSQNRFPETRNFVREDRMNAMSIVAETAMMAERLQAMEHRGLGDTREAARHRLARKTGVPESYLKRLRYEAETMKDVAGSVYRALRRAYDAAVEEEARRADAAKALREAIEHGLAMAETAPAPMVGGAAAFPPAAPSQTTGGA